MSKHIEDIGCKTGPMLIFGGCYSNFQALETLRAIAEKRHILPENIVHTGDLIGYCASPSACTDFVSEWGIHCIKGNVEENILSGADDCGCNYVEGGRCEMFSRSWFPYAKESISAENRRFLESMPDELRFEYGGRKVAVLHGSAHYISEFVFASTPWKTKSLSFEETQADVILAGHAGIPFASENEEKLWLNAGVIGMPANDGTPFVWYLLLDDSSGFHYRFQRFEYDNFEANQLMMEHSLPWPYAETLMTGVWDNTEILPETETKNTGIPLDWLLNNEVSL
ncbi:metallophosphatase family protein [Marinilongibacter aquaticus]|uniref:metallophosphoesterase family protein n=1 Tax=Marinilongibacter aquaticus TaxID=2975157 RepID=UPI0021BD4539|nr:metallophosphatase family protein [Marinilongibacter aquaticus]UBM57237.1 metallophosphatase family protein [Marinilongibacter aquaticus]